MTTTFVNKNSNLRNLIVLTILLRIAPLFIEKNKEVKGNDVHPLIYLKFIPSINITYVFRSIMNNQAMDIFRQQVMGRYGMFTFEVLAK